FSLHQHICGGEIKPSRDTLKYENSKAPRAGDLSKLSRN
ncbi:hypothetical protein JMJ77_0006532, partial [Colletotrichum scovillei]